MRSFVFGLVTILLSATAVLAQQTQNQNSPGAFMGSIVPMMVIMFVVIYFLMIRPEQKKQKDRQKMINNMKKGDRVVTIGGALGTVGNVKDHTVMVKIAENTVVEYRKSAISEVVVDKSEPAKEPPKDVKK